MLESVYDLVYVLILMVCILILLFFMANSLIYNTQIYQ